MTAYCFSSGEEGHSKLQNFVAISYVKNVLFLVIINSITVFQLIPPTEIANECVYILMNLLKSFCWCLAVEAFVT